MAPVILIVAGLSLAVLLLIVLAPLSFATGTLNTVINSALTKTVYPEEVGGTLGLSASLESLTRVVSPSAGGVLLQQLGPWAPGVFGALIMAWVVSFTWRRLITKPDAPLPPRAAEAAEVKPPAGEPAPAQPGLGQGSASEERK